MEKGRSDWDFERGLAVVSEVSITSTIVNPKLTKFRRTLIALRAPPHRAPLTWVRLRRGCWHFVQANESIVVG